MSAYHVNELLEQGVSKEHTEALLAMPNVNWVLLLQLVAKYGPQIVAEVLAVLGKGK